MRAAKQPGAPRRIAGGCVVPLPLNAQVSRPQPLRPPPVQRRTSSARQGYLNRRSDLAANHNGRAQTLIRASPSSIHLPASLLRSAKSKVRYSVPAPPFEKHHSISNRQSTYTFTTTARTTTYHPIVLCGRPWHLFCVVLPIAGLLRSLLVARLVRRSLSRVSLVPRLALDTGRLCGFVEPLTHPPPTPGAVWRITLADVIQSPRILIACCCQTPAEERPGWCKTVVGPGIK